MSSTDAAGRPLAGRVALVTGGSRGIGAATSERLAALGARVVLTYREDLDAAGDVARRIGSAGGSATTEHLDITEPERIHACLARVLDRHGRVDVLVSNASAPFRRAPLPDLTPDDVAGPTSVNLRAAHLLTTSLAPGMRERGWGRLVYLSSRHASGPSAPGMVANGTTKAALGGYVRYVVDELTGAGVTANVVSPGLVDTDASRNAGLPEGLRELLVAATPSARLASPDDIAAAVVAVVLGGDLLNGVDLPVAGGLNHPLPLGRLLPALQRS